MNILRRSFSPSFTPALMMMLALVAATRVGGADSSPNHPRAGECQMQMLTETSELEISYQGRRLLLYSYNSNQFKPYVRELYTVTGVNILRDAPADHLHHHGLMYAIRLNGINFWEETGEPGVQRPVKLENLRSGRNPAGQPEAGFTQWIHWVAFPHRHRGDTASLALLVERRTLTLTIHEATDEVALRWQSHFRVGAATPQLRWHGSAYNGLGLRLPATFDLVATHQNSANLPDTKAGQGGVLTARWSSVSGPVDDKPVCAVLFGHSANPGGQAHFFSMTRPFTYLSATQALDQSPKDYQPGDQIELRYLLTVYPQVRSGEFLHQRALLWEPASQEPLR